MNAHAHGVGTCTWRHYDFLRTNEMKGLQLRPLLENGVATGSAKIYLEEGCC